MGKVKGFIPGPAIADAQERAVSEASFYLEQIDRLTKERDAALKELSAYAREAGLAKGKLEASEAAGVVEMWKEHSKRLEEDRNMWKSEAEKLARLVLSGREK